MVLNSDNNNFKNFSKVNLTILILANNYNVIKWFNILSHVINIKKF